MSDLKLDTVEMAIRAIANGELVIIVDDDDRENEGDLVAAASRITPEQMAFIVRHTAGIVCAPMTRENARRLKLDPMVANNDAPHGTAFTVTVDYKPGLTTGISAKERTATVNALANPQSRGGDFVRPGHVFPLIAQEGGVLLRSGHTEAAVDLARLAGEPPVAVICELVNDDGSVKNGSDIAQFAKTHELKLISVNQLISYRQSRERLVEMSESFTMQTPAGEARVQAYTTPFNPVRHLALIFGDLGDGENVPVRLQRENLLDDVFGERSGLDQAYEVFQKHGRGVLVYLREGATGVPVAENMQLAPEEDTQSSRDREEAWREVGLGAQILRDLGLRSIRLITSTQRHYVGLSGFGLEIVATENVEN